jgi:hypothetical protein
MSDKAIRTGLCPGGRERLQRLLRLLEHSRVKPTLLTTHRFTFTEVDRALHLMDTKEGGIIKPLITLTLLPEKYHTKRKRLPEEVVQDHHDVGSICHGGGFASRPCLRLRCTQSCLEFRFIVVRERSSEDLASHSLQLVQHLIRRCLPYQNK